MRISPASIEQAHEQGLAKVGCALSEEETAAFARDCQRLWVNAPRACWRAFGADPKPDQVLSFPMRTSWLRSAMTGIRAVAYELGRVVNHPDPIISINRQAPGGIQRPHPDGPGADGIVAVAHATNHGGFYYLDQNKELQVRHMEAGDVLLQGDMDMIHGGVNLSTEPRFTAAVSHPTSQGEAHFAWLEAEIQPALFEYFLKGLQERLGR